MQSAGEPRDPWLEGWGVGEPCQKSAAWKRGADEDFRLMDAAEACAVWPPRSQPLLWLRGGPADEPPEPSGVLCKGCVRLWPEEPCHTALEHQETSRTRWLA